MANKETIKVTICGGGNGAHTVAGIASENDELSVTVLDIYKDKPERWNQALQENGFTIHLPNGDTLKQPPGNVKFTVTRDVSAAVVSADIVLIVYPAFAHDVYLELIAEHLSNDKIVVGMPGKPGFEFQCMHYLRKHGKKCSFMGLATLPWPCRINKYGEDVTVLGTKDVVETSVIDQGTSELDPLLTIQKIVGKTPVLKARSALKTILVSEAVFHPSIMYAKWRGWVGQELDVEPLFHQGIDQCAADILDAASRELIEVADKVKQLYPQFKELHVRTIHEWFLDHYGDQISDKSSLVSTLQTIKAFDGLVHPMKRTSSGKYIPNFTYRYMTEDVPYGIVVQRAIAEMVGVKTPVIDEIITWAQKIIGVDYLVDGKINDKLTGKTRIPQMYCLHSIDDLFHFCEDV